MLGWYALPAVSSQLKLTDFPKADGLKQYINWAVKAGFGVIDVNVPKHLTGLGVGAYQSHDCAITDLFVI